MSGRLKSLQNKYARRKHGYYLLSVRGKRTKKIYYSDVFERQNKKLLGDNVQSQMIASMSSASQMSPSVSDLPPQINDCEASQSYADNRAILSEEWRSMEPLLIKIALKNYRPSVCCCVMCKKTLNEIIRCEDCGLQTFYCKKCWFSSHEHVWYHKPDIFKNGMFIKFDVPPRTMTRQDAHECSSKYTRNLTIFDCKGFQHLINVTFCKCESEPETLLRHNLWSCSLRLPKVAVSVDLLEWFRTLQLEQHMSTTGFCNALEHRYLKTPGYKPTIKHLSKILLKEVMESYRQHVYQLQHLQGIGLSGMDDGSSCPACFDDSTTRMYSIDANFGLVRRAAAGIRSCTPHHQQLFFGSQSDVDAFVSTSPATVKKTAQLDCSDFQAGNELRSRGKNKKLDVKGVIGTCCKHEFPRLFVNLRHGERLEYAVWLIKQLLQTNASLKIHYDIACKLKAHLQLKKEHDILERVHFAVPVFHGYAHNMTCQLNFSPRRQLGFGLTEGETMERLWSYLRNFNKITKEMKPEHRHDLLNAAILHYGAKLKLKLGKTLCKRLERAKAVNQEAQSNLKLIMATRSHLAETPSLQQEDQPSTNVLSWAEKYAIQLHEYLNEQKLLHSMGDNQHGSAEKAGVVAKFDCTLSNVERRHGIQTRWLASDNEYTRTLANAVSKIRGNLLVQAHKENVERLFFIIF